MINQEPKLPTLPQTASSLPAYRVSSTGARTMAYSAMLTLALSLPQGLLALPIAVAQVGLARGLSIMMLIGALNSVTAAWTARFVAVQFMRHGIVPSLATLAHDRLGTWGWRLTLGSGTTLFFLALLASIVGLARSLADLTALPAPIWGVGCGLMILFLSLSRAALGSRLVIGLGLLNVGLIVALILLMLPHVQPMTVPAAAQGSSFVMIGVSLMLFFAPILVGPIAQQVLPHGGSPRAFVYGSAGGVAAGVVLFALWTVAVCGVASGRSLAEAVGASIPVIVATVPEVMFPAVLLGLALLGMTALRCALVLATLAEEQMPAQLGWRRRNLFAQMPTGLALVAALVLLLSGTTSFTLLIAIAGGGAASVTSVVIPTLLTHCTLITKHRSVAPKQLVSGEHGI